jgi:soluble lytic murein transglycosylase-like protein
MVTQRDTQRRAQPQGQGKPQQLMRPAKRQLLNENSLPIPPIPPTVVPPPAVPSQRSQPTSKNDLPYPPHVPPLNAEGNPMGHLVPNVAAAEPSMLRDSYNSNNPYVAEATRLAKEYGLPENIFLALIHQESRFDANALSPAGAIGLTQLMPGTASDMGVDPRDPMQNLEGGARYLAQQYKAFGEWPLALAAYNAGPSRVRKAGNVIPNNKETQNYVPTVLHNAGVAGYADGGLIALARKYADGGSVSRAAQVYDPAVIAAIAASITEPQGYAEGGSAGNVGHASEWDRYLPRDLPDSAFNSAEQNPENRHLNYQYLLDKGAIRITQPGSGKGPDPINSSDPNQWSLVSALNDQSSDPYTLRWASKPESYKPAIEFLSRTPIHDGKYRQILWSARNLGLRPDEVFMPKEEARSPAANGRGYADGGGVSGDDATPRTFADLVGRYGVGDAMQMAAPLDDPSLGAGVSSSVGTYLRPVVQGNFEIPGTVKKYAIDVATGPKPFTRLGSDISTFGSAVWEGVKNDPVGAVLDILPVVSNFRSAMDMHESRNRAVEAEQAGDEDRASMYRQFSALGAAGAIPLVGYGAIAARRAANAARDAAARRAGAGAGTALVVRGGVDDIDIGSGVGLIAREDAAAAAGARGTQAIAREGAEGVTAGTDVVAREGVGLEPSGAVARRAKAAARESAQAVAVVPRELSPLGFYSHGAETAANLAQAKGTPQQFRGMLEKYGVKPVELEGFDEAFANRPSVTREELAKHFSERRPQIEETVLGKTTKGQPYPDEFTKIEQNIQSRYLGEIQRLYSVNLDNAEPWSVRTEALKKAMDLIEEMDLKIYEAIPNREALIQATRDTTTPTKFQQYTLPGGENYREVLLRLDRPQAKVVDLEVDRRLGSGGGRWGVQMPDGTITSRFYEKFDAEQALRFDAAKQGVTFTSTHWDDPDVLAHLRFTDRAGPNGEKILHLEELQSDWGQKGRTEGFADPKPAAQWDIDVAAVDKVLRDALKEREDLFPPSNLEFENFYGRPDYQAISQRIRAARDAFWALGPRPTDSGIPSAPYVTNTAAWTDLALKRALKEAAEGGYDKIVWTPGVEQVKRYDLSKYVDKIAYDQEQKGFHYKAKGADDWSSYDKLVSPEELNSIIGKETADKLLAQKADEDGVHFLLNIKDISIGGEGMKAYYDKMVPNQLSKLVKRLDPDAKVGLTDVMLPQGTGRGMGHNNPPFKAPGLTITPKMREAIMKGQTDFAEGGHVQGYAMGGPAGNSLAALYEKYYGEPTARISYAQGGSVDSAPVYDPAVIAAIAASITEDNYA